MTSLWECGGGSGSGAAGARFMRPRSRLGVAASRARLLPRRPARIAARALGAARDARAVERRHRAVELDGVARRMVFARRTSAPETLARVAAAIAGTGEQLADLDPPPVPGEIERQPTLATEWIIAHLGHDRHPEARRAHAAEPRRSPAAPDARHRAGVEHVLRHPPLRRPADLPARRALRRASACCRARASRPPSSWRAPAALGVTHISGTPSHWRRALMSGAAQLARSRTTCACPARSPTRCCSISCAPTYPNARIAHAFASTEAGVAFDVDDGLAGFPAEFVEAPRDGIEMKVEDGTLRIRSQRNAARYLGSAPSSLCERATASSTPATWWSSRTDATTFGGAAAASSTSAALKVYPEEVEGVLNADPRVRMSLVRSKRNPIMGAVVVADVVLEDSVGSVARGPPGRRHQKRSPGGVPARAARAQGAGPFEFRARTRAHRRRQIGALTAKRPSCLTSS